MTEDAPVSRSSLPTPSRVSVAALVGPIPIRYSPSVPPCPYPPVVVLNGLRWVATKKKRTETNEQSKISYTVLRSKCPSLVRRPTDLRRFVSQATDSCKRKGRAEKVLEKEQQRYNNQPCLTFRHPKPRPAAWNSDGGETTDGRQRETKRRGRKHKDPAEITFVKL